MSVTSAMEPQLQETIHSANRYIKKGCRSCTEPDGREQTGTPICIFKQETSSLRGALFHN